MITTSVMIRLNHIFIRLFHAFLVTSLRLVLDGKIYFTLTLLHKNLLPLFCIYFYLFLLSREYFLWVRFDEALVNTHLKCLLSTSVFSCLWFSILWFSCYLLVLNVVWHHDHIAPAILLGLLPNYANINSLNAKVAIM